MQPHFDTPTTPGVDIHNRIRRFFTLFAGMLVIALAFATFGINSASAVTGTATPSSISVAAATTTPNIVAPAPVVSFKLNSGARTGCTTW